MTERLDGSQKSDRYRLERIDLACSYASVYGIDQMVGSMFARLSPLYS